MVKIEKLNIVADYVLNHAEINHRTKDFNDAILIANEELSVLQIKNPVSITYRSQINKITKTIGEKYAELDLVIRSNNPHKSEYEEMICKINLLKTELTTKYSAQLQTKKTLERLNCLQKQLSALTAIRHVQGEHLNEIEFIIIEIKSYNKQKLTHEILTKAQAISKKLTLEYKKISATEEITQEKLQIFNDTLAKTTDKLYALQKNSPVPVTYAQQLNNLRSTFNATYFQLETAILHECDIKGIASKNHYKYKHDDTISEINKLTAKLTAKYKIQSQPKVITRRVLRR